MEPPSSVARDPKAMHLEQLLALPLSASMRRVIDEGRQTAVNESFRGFFGTGLLLLSLEKAGRIPERKDAFYAPTFFANQIDRRVGARFTIARKKFYDENRLPPDTTPEKPEWFSLHLKSVFEAAQQLPRHDGIIAARHVIVALLLFQPDSPEKATNAWEVLRSAGLDPLELAAEFLTSLAEHGPVAEREQWQWLAGQHATGASAPAGSWSQTKAARDAEPAQLRGPWIAGFHADWPSGRAADDCLNLDATVNAMANLIASPQLDGTISIGVFGHWGSGKSFFMARLREAIDQISARARGTDSPDKKPDYWPNVAQIEFNAWHYVDANLWASLMSHLLEQLRRWNPSAMKTIGPTPLERAIEKLQITSSARIEAERRVQVARDARAAAETHLQNAQQTQSRAARDLAEATARSVYAIAADELAGPIAQARAIVSEVDSLAATATQAVEPVVARVRELTTTAGRLHAVVQRLLEHKSAGRELMIVGGIVAVPLLVLLIASAVANWEWLRSAGTTLAVALAGAIGALTKAVAWIQKNSAAVLERLAPLGVVRDRIESVLTAAEGKKTRMIADAAAAAAASQATVDAAVAELAACEEAARAAALAVSDAVSGRAISRFIETRLATGDYQKYLGLIATIRRDFEQLSELIGAHNATRLGIAETVAGIERTLRSALPDTSEAELAGLLANIGINRIVLYIDDLDRCPSDHVVEVLQAIHLLLSFPIFVVVVGVDSRWMSHSLAREYPALLTRAASSEETKGWSREAGLAVVTPADYLEKIFQIPFWVPPLKTASAQALIAKLTARNVIDGVNSPRPLEAPPANANAPAPAPAGEEKLSSPAPDAAPPPRQPTTEDAPQIAVTASTNVARTDFVDTTVVTLPPAVLVVDDDERAAMQSLAALIGRSPRATKRFVNSYRLLKAALTDEERLALSGPDAALGGMAAPMFLLAIVTGIPTLAAEFVGMLPANPHANALHQLFALAEWSTADVVHLDAANRIREFQRSPDDRGRWEQLSSDGLRPWITRVSQFSFEDLVPADEREGGRGRAAVVATASSALQHHA